MQDDEHIQGPKIKFLSGIVWYGLLNLKREMLKSWVYRLESKEHDLD